MRRNVNIAASLDWITVLIYIVLVIMGWVNIYAAVYNDAHKSILDFTQRYGLQLLWIIAALFIAMVIMIIDTKFYTFFAYFIYGFSILLLLLVLVIGREVNGAKAWLSIGRFSIQPAEFAKLGISLALAKYLSAYNIKINSFRTLLNIGFIFLIPIALIALQPDAGSILVFLSLSLVLFREGLPGWVLILGFALGALFILALLFSKVVIVAGIIIVGFGAFALYTKQYKVTALGFFIFAGLAFFIWGVLKLAHKKFDYYYIYAIAFLVSGVLFVILSYSKRIKQVTLFVLSITCAVLFTFSVDYVFHRMLEPHQQRRVEILLGLESDPLGVGYNVNQSMIAIGSGGFFGKGFLQGTQTKYDFVPEQSTDFIFCTVGEEWGFFGTFVVVILFLILMLRVLFLAERQRSAFSRIYGYCVAAILFFHFAINIGMTIGLLPVIGIPLPFFSYGGSSLWSFTILLFILIRFDASRMELLK